MVFFARLSTFVLAESDYHHDRSTKVYCPGSVLWCRRAIARLGQHWPYYDIGS